MPLPILQANASSDPQTLIRLFHKTQHHWTQHLAEEEQLSIGSAFANPDLSRIHNANCILDAAIPQDVSLPNALAEVQSHFASRGLRCLKWVTNPSTPIDQLQPLIETLEQTGHQKKSSQIFHLNHMPTRAIPQATGLKIIPARASFRHAQQLAEEIATEWNEPQLIQANLLHLEDPHWDALIALKDGNAVAKIGVLAIGEVGLIQEVFVSKNHRSQGIGRTMMSRALEICARSLFKHIFLSCNPANTPAISLYEKLGFQKLGESISYLAPSSPGNTF
jgi:ribosomal-protein-alanine N-acetyltransferase